MIRRGAWTALSFALLAACASSGDRDPGLEAAPAFGQIQQPIVRGKPTEAFPQVVMLHVRRSASTTRCSGSYIAPRVVLTAAHCIGTGPIPLASYVYFGTDPAPDSGTFPEIPPAGEPSDLARVEGFRVHPDYDPGVNYPDLALVYLDRELPFEPLPLFTQHLGRAFVGDEATIVGWGGSKALVADISQVEGAGTQRRGRVKIVGSPTAADFHDDDPNPGMLDPTIRAASIKSDGRAPNSNGCAGDSGGPLLIGEHGRWYVGGVGYWTGLWCEDYAIYTRIDPFLDFIHEGLRFAGQKAIVPRLECVDQAEDGSYTAFFGYDNHNDLSVEIPHSPRNSLPADTAQVRPELFGPGDHPWEFSIAFKGKERLQYRLVSPSGQSTRVTADRHSPRCDCTAACDASFAAECYDGEFTRAECVDSCADFGQLFPDCQSELNAYWRCEADLSPAEENWTCEEGFFPQPVPCQDEFFAALGCAGYL